MSNELVDVATFGLAWEAHLAQSRLEEAGIESFLQGEHVFQMVPYAADPTGIRLQVPQHQIERASQILAAPDRGDEKEH
ncbi:MAG: DUF2007 domain-containing protein [Planctomycetaceae bacterium]|nr:DUF2007 domain-containing protein [Planctomycetaceae bacterium]